MVGAQPLEKTMTIFDAVAQYREGNLDLAGLLIEAQKIDPTMTVQQLAGFVDAYFANGGE